MKSIRTTTIALVGAALLTLGALTGCSSDSDDKSSDKTTASEESKDSKGDDAKGSDSKGSDSKGSAVDTEFCTPYESMSTIDVTDYDALIEFWEGWKASAPSDVKGDFDTIIDVYKMARDGDMAGYSGKVQEVTDATTNVTNKVAEVCS